MSIGPILVIVPIIFLPGGFGGRFGDYGYDLGHDGMGIGGTILAILIVLLLPGKIRQFRGLWSLAAARRTRGLFGAVFGIV